MYILWQEDFCDTIDTEFHTQGIASIDNYSSAAEKHSSMIIKIIFLMIMLWWDQKQNIWLVVVGILGMCCCNALKYRPTHNLQQKEANTKKLNEVCKIMKVNK